MSQWCCGLQEEAEIFHITGLEFISSCHGTLLSTTLTISVFSSLLQIWITRKSMAQADVLKSRGVKNYISWEKKLVKRLLAHFHLSEARETCSFIIRDCLFVHLAASSSWDCSFHRKPELNVPLCEAPHV